MRRTTTKKPTSDSLLKQLRNPQLSSHERETILQYLHYLAVEKPQARSVLKKNLDTLDQELHYKNDQA